MPVRRGRRGRTEWSSRSISGIGTRNRGIAAILSPLILFVCAKLRNTTKVPRDFAVPGAGRLARSVSLEVVVSMQRDHQALESESGALWPALWMGAAVVAVVLISYWLNMV